MADYYREAREAKRALKDVSVDNKRRREQRKADGLEDDGVEHPLNHLTMSGRACKLYKDSAQHAATESQQGLIAWNDDAHNLIDRFDCRCLLDFYQDPHPGLANKNRSRQEQKLEELLQFESFRDLVRLMARGLSEEAGLKVAWDQSLEVRAARRVVATTAFRVQSHQPVNPDALTAAAGLGGPGQQQQPGGYNAVGFSYGGTQIDTSSGSDESDDSGDEGPHLHMSADQAAAEAEQDRLDDLAEQMGIKDFAYRLQKSAEAEGEAEASLRGPPRKKSGRKAGRERARRMAGQGLDPHGKPLFKDWHDPLAMNAPSAHTIRPRRPSPERGAHSDSRSRSRSPRGGGYGSSSLFALPTAKGPSIDRKAFERDEDSILEALPDGFDPALPGAQMFPRDVAMQNIIIKQQQEAQRRRRSRSRDRWDRRHSRSRSRSRDRYRYGRSRSRGRYSRDRRGSRERSGGRGGSPPRGAGRSANSSGGAGAASSSKATPVTKAAPQAAETPQERLKRIMAAQLAKQQNKDTAITAARKIQAEKEKVAREAIDRALRAPSPSRRYSPPRRRY